MMPSQLLSLSLLADSARHLSCCLSLLITPSGCPSPPVSSLITLLVSDAHIRNLELHAAQIEQRHRAEISSLTDALQLAMSSDQFSSEEASRRSEEASKELVAAQTEVSTLRRKLESPQMQQLLRLESRKLARSTARRWAMQTRLHQVRAADCSGSF